MEFEAKASDVIAAVSHASIAVERRADPPWLSNLKVEAWQDLGVKVAGFGLTLSAGARMKATIAKDGAVAVDQHRLLSMVSKLPADKIVKFKLTETTLVVRCGKSRYEFLTFNAMDFPNFPKPSKPDIKMQSSAWVDLIRLTEQGMATDERYAHLHGTWFEYDGEKATMVTTDSKRLLKSSVAFESKATGIVFIPYRGVQAISKFCDSLRRDAELSIQVTDSYLFLWTDELGLATKLIDAKKINYEKVVPENFDTKLIVERQALIDSLERLAVMSDRPVRIYGDDKGVEITTANPEAGTGREVVRGTVKGKSEEATLPLDHLLEFLKVLSDTKVVLRYNGGRTPLMLKQKKGSASFAIFSPIASVE